MTSFYLKRFSESVNGPRATNPFLFFFYFSKLSSSILYTEIKTPPTSSLSTGSLGSTAVGVQILMS